MSNLAQRVLTAIVGVGILLAAILYSSWTYGLVFLLIAVLTQLEFYRLVGLDGNQPLIIWGAFCGIMLNICAFLVEKGQIPSKYYYLLVPIFSVTFFIKLYRKKATKPFTDLAFTFLGLIYVAMPFVFMHSLSWFKGHYQPHLILGFLFLLWANDSGAYFAGKNFGKRKLFERISPKKTWEGFVGGAILSLLVAFVLGKYFTELATWQWCCISLIVVVTGTLGDLVESLFKRSIAIKDSGSMIPGHGGFLDRFDALLLSIPFVLTFLLFFA